MAIRPLVGRAAVALMVLSGLFAYARRRDRARWRREAFLGEMNCIAYLGMTAQEALTEKLRLLCDYFAANACLLLCEEAGSGEYAFYRVALGEAAPEAPARLTREAAAALLELPDDAALAWNANRQGRGELAEPCRRLANLLEASHFVTAAYRRHQRVAGRLYVISGERAFTRDDSAVLARAANQLGTVVDLHEALDELKADATLATGSVSRDFHEAPMQSTIGLRFGIHALFRSLDPASPMARQVKELLDMSSTSVEELRRYVERLHQMRAGR